MQVLASARMVKKWKISESLKRNSKTATPCITSYTVWKLFCLWKRWHCHRMSVITSRSAQWRWHDSHRGRSTEEWQTFPMGWAKARQWPRLNHITGPLSKSKLARVVLQRLQAVLPTCASFLFLHGKGPFSKSDSWMQHMTGLGLFMTFPHPIFGYSLTVGSDPLWDKLTIVRSIVMDFW